MKRLNLITLLLLLCLALQAGERKAVVIFMQFSDLKFSTSYQEFQGLADSLTLYFNDQFKGQTVFSFRRGPVITLDESFKKYGENSSSYRDDQMYNGVLKACRMAADSLDYSEFSLEGKPSEVHDVLVLVPGKSEIDSSLTTLFWPQYVDVSSRHPNNQFISTGHKLMSYGVASELGEDGRFTGIGTIAHEYCHILGLSDLYDTDEDGSGGLSRCLWGTLDIMDTGNRNCGGHTPPYLSAPNRYTLGIGGVAISEAGNYTLEPVSRNGRYFVFKGPLNGEVFLAESRIDEGWDSGIGGCGLVIYHYDRSDGGALYSDWLQRNVTARERWTYNQVNCNPGHQCVQLMAPDSTSAFFPCKGKDSFTSETTPAFRFWDGTGSPLALTGISKESDGSISFSLIKPITILSASPYQTGSTIRWNCSSDITEIDSCIVICSHGSDTLSRCKGTDLGQGEWCCTLDGLSPGSSYYATVTIMRKGNIFFSAGIRFTTYGSRPGQFPFIFLKGIVRNADGSFPADSRIPLQVFGAAKAKELQWSFNERPIETGPDGLFTIPSSGRLKVRIYWEDGSCDVIIKDITVK